MAEETTITTTRKIYFGPNHLTGYNKLDSQEVIRVLKECRNNTRADKRIVLHSTFSDQCGTAYKLSETVEIRNTILECRNYIERFNIWNKSFGSNEYLGCLYFFLKFLHANNGTKHYVYIQKINTTRKEWSLEHANQLAYAIQSNNNGHIESFQLEQNFSNVQAFESFWNAVLDNGVRYLLLCCAITRKKLDGNNNINFSTLTNNLTLKKLEINMGILSQQELVNLFDSIKSNKGLEKVIFNRIDITKLLRWRRERTSFNEMLHGNVTLVDVQMPYTYKNYTYWQIQEDITMHMKFNYIWKRYIIKRKEVATAAVATAMVTSTGTDTSTSIVTASLTAQADKKKIFRRRLLLHLFMDKPVMCSTFIFHLLSENPDVVNDVQQNQMLHTSICFANSNQKKRSYRTYEEKAKS